MPNGRGRPFYNPACPLEEKSQRHLSASGAINLTRHVGELRSRGRLATWIFRSIPSSEAAIQYSLGRQPGESPRGNGPTATRTEGARSLFELIPNLIARRKPPVRLGIDRYYYALSALGVWFIAFPRAGAWLAP